MKKSILLFGAIFATIAAAAQTPGSPSQTTTEPIATTNQLGLGTLSFTNRSGETYSVDQLASQLRNLRSAVEQTLPMLTAFNESFSNAAPGGISGAISGILSGALNRKSEESSEGAASKTSQRLGNVVSALQGLLTTNATSSVPVNPNTQRELITLQGQLQPVATTLSSLNVSTNTINEIGRPSNVLTPTGR